MLIFIQFLLILSVLLILLFLTYFFIAFFIGAPFVVTPSAIVDEMLRVAGVKKGDIVADLGSGDGRILIESAKKGATAYGWEINPLLVLWTMINARTQKVSKRIIVSWKNYHQADLHDATVVIFYNIPLHLPALEKKLVKELKSGTKIISYQFELSKFKLQKQTPSGIFIYKT